MASETDSRNGKYFNPKSLYSFAILTITNIHENIYQELKIFPADIHFDIIYGLYEKKHYKELSYVLSNLENLTKFLKLASQRTNLHICFQTMMDYCLCSEVMATKPSLNLAHEFLKKVSDSSANGFSDKLINQGLSISSFLSEAGWLKEAELILLECRKMIRDTDNSENKVKHIECLQRLLHVQNGYCQFKSARKTYEESAALVHEYKFEGSCPNVAVLYAEISTFFMLQSDYEQAYQWSLESMVELVPSLVPTAIVDVYRQTAKSCVLKRQFKKAGLLIREAIKIARVMLKENRLKYAETLIDYGFYLLNVDEIHRGISVYELALKERQTVFGLGSKNLHVATAHEDLAYASYVHNYSNGLFQDARNQAEKAISLLLCLLPTDHLLLSSCKRVKALILEEMALENTDKDIEAKYLQEAHSLHTEALNLSLEAFGEMNVQTAKHYGNLGRLYQSMKKFENAEAMHLKAIRIKEALLGPSDYEVALSVGHLASLYNYDMGLFGKAEILYLRSIAIGKKLFGEAYSGLEYDYRGLLRVYANQFEIDKRLRYMNILSCWKVRREQLRNNDESPFNEEDEQFYTVEFVVQQFMEL